MIGKSTQMMDQPQKENRNSTIWNKFESAAPGIPDWIRNKEQTGSILQTLLKTIPAQSILITTTSEIFLLAGDVETKTQQKILQVLDAFWDPIQKSDLTRYLKNQNGEVTGFIFSANLFQNLILTLYYQDTPTLSMARAHTKRIIRALSGQTVASYAAKTVPVDAAMAAQMRKFFEQNARQSMDREFTAADELPLPQQMPESSQPDASPSLKKVTQPLAEETPTTQNSSLDELLPSMDELLGNKPFAQPVSQQNSEFQPDQIPMDSWSVPNQEPATKFETQPVNLPIDENKITDTELAMLADELDEFFEDDDSDIDLEEQKEKLASILQELPSPDPDKEEDLQRAEKPIMGTIADTAEFTLPWEGQNQPGSPVETAPVMLDGPEEEVAPAPSFKDAMQQVYLDEPEPVMEDRNYTVVIIPRIAFHQLGQSFENKFELYVHQACQFLQCESEGCGFFSDHLQIKLKLTGKSSIVKTIMQLKKQLEIKILENYATFSDELNGNDLWIPGQLIFNDQEKLDSKRIQAFVDSAHL
jgi:hypothetical protein